MLRRSLKSMVRAEAAAGNKTAIDIAAIIAKRIEASVR
jgi:hypothetical protein